MRRTFLVGLLAAACAALPLAPAAVGKPPQPFGIVSLAGYSDGYDSTSDSCGFHVEMWYDGKTYPGMEATYVLDHNLQTVVGYGTAPVAREKYGSMYKFTGSFDVSLSQLTTASDYHFTIRVDRATDEGSVLLAYTFTEPAFALDATTFENGCPAKSATPLAST